MWNTYQALLSCKTALNDQTQTLKIINPCSTVVTPDTANTREAVAYRSLAIQERIMERRNSTHTEVK